MFLRTYLLDVSGLEDPDRFRTAYECLPQERREKTDRMKVNAGKRLSTGAGLLLQYALLENGVAKERMRFLAGEHGKPALCDGRICFNLSHSGEHVMCTVSDGEVGCDVEQIKKADIRVAERFFDPEEFRLLQAAPSEQKRTELFFRLWTIRESYIKFTGEGMYASLKEIRVENVESHPVLFRKTERKDLLVESWKDADGYAYAVCTENGPEHRIVTANLEKILDISPKW